MRPTLEGTVADEEVLLDVAHHALVLAFRACPVGSASAWREPVMGGQVEKTLVETGLTLVGGLKHGDLLVVHQHFLSDAAEVLQTADQAFVGMLGIQTVGAPDVEPPRVTQRIYTEVHLGGLPGHLYGDFTPVGLQLLARTGFETNGNPAGPQRPFVLDVAPYQRNPTPIAVGLDLAQDHHRIPD